MPFDFNFYSSLLLPAFFQGMIFSSMLVCRSWREDNRSDGFLALLIILFSIRIAYWMLGFAGWFDSHDAYTSFMFYFPFETMLWIGPALYFYFLSLTNVEFRFSRKHFIHLVLPLASLAVVIFKFLADFTFYYPFRVAEETQYGTKGPWADLLRTPWAQALGYLSFFYYLFITLKAYHHYQKYIRENFSATEIIEFRWIRNMIYAVAAGILVFFLFEILGEIVPGAGSYRFDWYAYFGLGLLVYYISISGFFSNNRNLLHLHFVPKDPEDPGEEQTSKPVSFDESVMRALVDHMKSSKPYLEPELTLSDLARQLKTNPSVLSKVINEGFGQNFNDHINEFRIHHVMEKLRQGEHKYQTILAIALDAGFNSKATFNRAFRKMTGKSPKEWLAEQGLPAS